MSVQTFFMIKTVVFVFSKARQGPRKALHILYLSVCTDIFYDKDGSVCVWIMGMAYLGKTIIIMCFYQVVVGLTLLVINLDFWSYNCEDLLKIALNTCQLKNVKKSSDFVSSIHSTVD